jgi:bifunctional DNA-binding transcriptional regulator/antitoxin component of YhaV-PrlF toxin-antitoxin module
MIIIVAMNEQGQRTVPSATRDALWLRGDDALVLRLASVVSGNGAGPTN